MRPDVLFRFICGRPLMRDLVGRFEKVIDIAAVNEDFVGRSCAVLYYYPEPMFGNYHMNVFCNGVFVVGGGHSYDRHIWILDAVRKDIVMISKRRFGEKMELWVERRGS